jgi:flagellar biosynthesis protein FlhB
MTDEEFRREIKEDQTSPEVLRRRAQRRDELRTAHMIERLADADFGTLNPTHIACFLRYDSSKEGAPRVIAKGRGWAAKLLIEAARRKGVPMVRRPSLARALFKLRVDSQIPRELHVAVATVMNWLDRQASDRGRSTKWSARRSQDDL